VQTKVVIQIGTFRIFKAVWTKRNLICCENGNIVLID